MSRQEAVTFVSLDPSATLGAGPPGASHQAYPRTPRAVSIGDMERLATEVRQPGAPVTLRSHPHRVKRPRTAFRSRRGDANRRGLHEHVPLTHCDLRAT